MTKLKKTIFLYLLISFASGFFAKDAHAYIDPGTGSYLMQLILAAILGSIFAIKMFWKNIILFFKNLFSPKKDKND